MLDTIIAELPQDSFGIIKPERFAPFSPEQLRKFGKGFGKTSNNPTPADKKTGLYLPRLTLLQRGSRQFLKTEFSAPKILFGNNVDEISDTDKEAVLGSLQDKLAYMGIKTWTHKLPLANVIGFHSGKNILISRTSPADFVIRQLRKIAQSSKMDFTERTFTNNGEALYLYAKSHSLIIYDKIKDLEKPAARAIDKDQIARQMSLFDDWKKENIPMPNLLRIEIRLNEKRVMNPYLTAAGLPANPTLGQLFNTELHRRIIQTHWDTMFRDNSFLLGLPSQPLDLFQQILSAFPQMSTKELLGFAGLALTLNDSAGVSGFRKMMKSNSRAGSWKMIKSKMAMIAQLRCSPALPEYIATIENSLEMFSPIRKEALKSCPLGM